MDMKIEVLIESLKEVTDSRRPWGNKRHNLLDILAIALLSFICNASNCREMEAFGRFREAELRQFLDLPNGIPDSTTFFRVLKRVEPSELARSLYEWVASVREKYGKLFHIDGKTIRGSATAEQNALHIVSLWAGEGGIVLGQLAIDEKSNEIIAIPKLLKLLDVKGGTITIDAMGCQTEIAKQIRKKDAHYIFALKDNQPTLYSQTKDYFEGMEQGEIKALPDDIWTTDEEKMHGRIERREVSTVSDISWLDGKEKWPDIHTIIRYRSWRTEKGKTTQTDRYFISDLDVDAQDFYRSIRSHWSIENNLHWSLDVVFREDESQVSVGNAPENLNIIRKTALMLLRAADTPTGKNFKKLTGPQKRFIASLDSTYMFQVLFGK